MVQALAEKTCVPCQGGIPPLGHDDAERLHDQAREWDLVDGDHRIERRFKFRNFREALNFVIVIGALAETEGHHPDVGFGWGYVTVSLQTKKIGGLHENDFIMASKIDQAFERANKAAQVS
jgi:4a-hydroxytetrahydrobiopterin dehydratase